MRQNYAQPFMRPAAERVRPGFEKAFENKITDEDVEGVVVKTAFNMAGIAAYEAPKDTTALADSIHVTEDRPA